MSLLAKFLELLCLWAPYFCQKRNLPLAMRLAIGLISVPSRKTISRAICCNGREQKDWSNDYKFFSRSPWESHDLFRPSIAKSIDYSYQNYINLGFDDSAFRRSGSHIPGVSYCRDPMSPPFHVNLILGKRFLQASALLPQYHQADVPALGIPVAFKDVPPVKKPGRKASSEEFIAYKEAKKKRNLSTAFVALAYQLRHDYDLAGAKDKILVCTGDGSFTNKTVFTSEYERTIILSRARKDAKLCYQAPLGGRRFYDIHKFTPYDVQKDKSIPWHHMEVFIGGKYRHTRYKELKNILWQGGAKRRKLRLIVIAPTPYHISKKGRKFYRKSAYLFTTDMHAPVEMLIQMYIDRFQIEINFRDEKQNIGVGQAQVRNENSVPRQPSFVVAAYSLLLLSALELFGPERTMDYLPLPKWRQKPKRASSLDIIELLRKDICEDTDLLKNINVYPSAIKMAAYAMG
jgi:hypothetical protein